MMAVDFSRVKRTRKNDSRSWHGSAFIVEALVLLLFLAITLAVLAQMVGLAHNQGSEANQLSGAITLASNDAEMFAANPTAGAHEESFVRVDGQIVPTATQASVEGTVLTLTRTVDEESRSAGTLYKAHISVSNGTEVLFEVDTSRYVSLGKEA